MKRILGILILLVGTVGVFCSVIAAPYVWTTIDRVKVNLLAFTEALDEPLNVVDEKVEQAQGAIGKTMKGVKKANGFVNKLGDNQLSDEQAKQLEKITNELNEYFQVAHMLVRVGAGGAEAFAKSEGLVKRVPFLKNTQVSADDIRQAADGLAELSKLFDELDGKIKKARADKTGAQEIRKVVTDLSGRIDSKLSTAKARLEDFD